jgi:hypothetical protein
VKAGKRAYGDLMFTNENENFIRWMENLEIFSRKIIYNNRAKWFETELEEHDIENSFASPLKIFKSGKYYIARVNVPNTLGKMVLKIYDENENIVDSETLKENENVATILEIQGIRCSPRMFQIDMEMKQLLILKPVDLFEKCILRTTQKLESLEESTAPQVVEEPIPTPVKEEVVDPIEEEPVKSPDDLEEFDLKLDSVSSDETLFLKKRDEVYYKMYREALKKAKIAKELALTSYLEAKHIKNTYMLTDLSDESDLEEDTELEKD